VEINREYCEIAKNRLIKEGRAADAKLL